MAYKKFKDNDIFHNTLELHPQFDFIVFDSKVYKNSRGAVSGAFVANAGGVSTGDATLYELNVDRSAGELIYPYTTKKGSLSSFKTITTSDFNSSYVYGDIIQGSYPLSASLVRQFFAASTTRMDSANRLASLKNTLNSYRALNEHYQFSGSLGDKGTQNVNLISVPSIFFGSQIKKGTVDCSFYVSGTLIGRLKDENQDGALIQVGPEGSTNSGSTAGVVLYNEGFVVLTGSWSFSKAAGFSGERYTGASVVAPKWIYFGAGMNDGLATAQVVSSSFQLSFKGTTKTQTITMLAHAQKGEFNHSNNPTFKSHGQDSTPISSSTRYYESPNLTIKNIVSSSYPDPTGSFQKTTYISSIGIYDEDKNLIGIAKVATPVKKTENREFTFKLKLDI